MTYHRKTGHIGICETEQAEQISSIILATSTWERRWWKVHTPLQRGHTRRVANVSVRAIHRR